MADQGETRYGTAPGEALPVKRRRIYERWQGNEVSVFAARPAAKANAGSGGVAQLRA